MTFVVASGTDRRESPRPIMRGHTPSEALGVSIWAGVQVGPVWACTLFKRGMWSASALAERRPTPTPSVLC